MAETFLENAIQRVFLVCLTKWSSRSLMAGVLTAAKLGVGLGAAFLFQRKNLGSWKFGLGALSSVALCFVLICLGTNPFRGNPKF